MNFAMQSMPVYRPYPILGTLRAARGALSETINHSGVMVRLGQTSLPSSFHPCKLH